MGGGAVERLQQDLREARLPDQGGAVHAGAEQRNQQARAQQALQRGPSGRQESVQPDALSCPVEDRGVVSG